MDAAHGPRWKRSLHRFLVRIDRGLVDSNQRSLTADPRIERLEVRRELARVRAGYRLAVCLVIVVAAAVAQWKVGPGFAVIVGVASAALGVAWDRWQGASADDERIEQDLRALTTIYHESPLTIRRWLTAEFIEDSIHNLLAAALNSEEMADGYWRQAVQPFLEESSRGFRSGWRYQITLADLAGDLVLEVPGGADVRVGPDTHRRLHTAVSYAQRIPQPGSLYHVAVVFDGQDLPGWFKRPNFLLREVVVLPAEVISRLPPVGKEVDALPDPREQKPQIPLSEDPLAKVAAAILDATVVIGEDELRPVSLHIDQSGISWGFRLSEKHRASLQTSGQIRVDLDTLMSLEQRYFPVVISAPTRNPTVHFNYAMASDITSIETEVFFSAERPWDARLRTERQAYRQIEVLTESADWVFTGSGCIFIW